MIINEKTPFSRAMYWELKRHASEGIPVYQQQIWEPDVWHILDGDKDDFLIYDRCNRLAFHIQLPYSFLHLPYVEAAVRYTYHKDYCGNCSWYHSNSSQEVNNTTAHGITTETIEVTPKNIPKSNPEEERQEAPNTQHIPHHHSLHGEKGKHKVLTFTSTEHPSHHSQKHQGGTSQ
ncbi:hypothetical protein JRQ81_014993 [Phrynocephalus forsythii]|uniref:Selenoprotein P N-terminal domain-containing protein n=1 Tax=Phrynocephalus forsythii TaxID=171643 RepID=A0A9Q0Y0C9_9SAUR|nr:hypothetical protein JRQ81_014993 [Phrynocephalus forsythii]